MLAFDFEFSSASASLLHLVFDVLTISNNSLAFKRELLNVSATLLAFVFDLLNASTTLLVLNMNCRMPQLLCYMSVLNC